MSTLCAETAEAAGSICTTGGEPFRWEVDVHSQPNAPALPQCPSNDSTVPEYVATQHWPGTRAVVVVEALRVDARSRRQGD